MRMKALNILERNLSATEKAPEYIKFIKRKLFREIIEKLEKEIEDKEDHIFSLLDMSITTDVNQGVVGVTKETAEKKFKAVIEAEYELELMKLELKAKRKSFKKYFGKDEVSDKADD